MDGSIAYISDIGADILKPLFIVGTCFTGVGFVLTLIAERLLRHEGRSVPINLPPSRLRWLMFHTDSSQLCARESVYSLYLQSSAPL